MGSVGPWVGVVATAGALAAWFGLRRAARYNYAVDPRAPWGPRWRDRRPPGLPPTARLASRPQEARKAVEAAASRQRLGPAFVAAVLRLGEVESDLTFGRPTNRFDARCRDRADASRRRCTLVDGRRPADAPLTTAWGVFQVTIPTWQTWTRSLRQPWEASPAQEVEVPVAKLAEHWQRAKQAGAPDWAAQRAVFLGHNKPAALREFLQMGPRAGWDAAWQYVRAMVYRGKVDQYLGGQA